MSEAKASLRPIAARVPFPTRSARWMLPVGAGALAGFLLALARRAGGGERRILKPVLKVAARRALVGRSRSALNSEQGRFTGAEVDRILRQLWRNYDELVPGIPREPTFGARMNLRLACVTVAAYRALVTAGIEKDEAIRLFADVAWKVYVKWGVLPALIARILTRDPVKRMRICVNTFLRFPFNPPGYTFERLPADDGIAFDMRRCPVADYFRSHDLGQLCVGTWCSQDYALAELWGGSLERSRTLAAGDDHCDFRWKAVRVGRGKGH